MKINGIVCILMLLMCVPAFAVPTLNLGPVIVSGSTISFPVILAGSQGASITGIEADILFNRSSDSFALKMNGISIVSATDGAAAIAAGKQISQDSPRDGVLHIAAISFGNSSAILDGVIAQISFDIITAATSNNESFAIVPAASGPSGSETITGSGTPALATRPLSVTLAGNGDGSLNSLPPGLACTGGSCSANFYAGSSVTLMPTAAIGSSFGQWTGDCAGNGNGDCTVSMTASRSAAASFGLNNAVRVGFNHYGTLNSAYSNAPKGVVIQARDVTFIENLDLNLDSAVTLAGGYESTFQNRPGFTAIDGTLTISNGSFVADRLIVQ